MLCSAPPAAARRAPALAAVAIAATLLTALAVAPPPAAAAACQGATAHPTETSTETIRRATLCLLNEERRGEGLDALRHNAQLAVAARRHARDMVERTYFSHDSPSGMSFVRRIERTGYTRNASWTVGENLAWGSGRLATPVEVVKAWMASPGHRANILGRFSEVGIGTASGAPVRRLDAAETYATEFGARRY